MRYLIGRPRLILALVSIAVVAGLAAAPTPQPPQTAPGDDASRFTGATTALDATGLRASRRRFEAGARAAWHTHEGGQILFVEQGKGRVQRRGQPIRDMLQGEMDYTPPNVEHWHGAAPDQAVVQTALSGGAGKWLEKVSDAEYLGRSPLAPR